MEFERIEHLTSLLKGYCESKEDCRLGVKINEGNINNIIFMIKRLSYDLKGSERGIAIGRLKEVLYYIDKYIEKLMNLEDYKVFQKYALEDMCVLYKTKDEVEEIINLIVERVQMDNNKLCGRSSRKNIY